MSSNLLLFSLVMLIVGGVMFAIWHIVVKRAGETWLSPNNFRKKEMLLIMQKIKIC